MVGVMNGLIVPWDISVKNVGQDQCGGAVSCRNRLVKSMAQPISHCCDFVAVKGLEVLEYQGGLTHNDCVDLLMATISHLNPRSNSVIS